MLAPRVSDTLAVPPSWSHPASRPERALLLMIVFSPATQRARGLSKRLPEGIPHRKTPARTSPAVCLAVGGVGFKPFRSSSDRTRSKVMSEHANIEEIRIKALLESWADAVRRHDIRAILAHHEPDMVMFDLPPPLQCKGIEAYEQTWDLLFRYHKPGTAFDIEEIAVTAGQDVAFAVAIMRCGPNSSSNPADKDGFLFRLTVGLRKVDGTWRIAHEHHSVPAAD